MTGRTSTLVLAALAVAACDAAPPIVATPDTAVPTVPAPPPLLARAPIETGAPAPPPAPAAAPPRPSVTPGEAAAALARAEKCIADPDCTDDVDALYRKADDGGAAGVSCFRFYWGVGVAKDLGRARACFERKVAAEPPCTGESPGLDRVNLASMLVDAQGGPADAARAEALFAGCFADASVTGVLAEIPTRSQPDPARQPLDFCRDIGGTTYSIGMCHVAERERLAVERARLDKLVFPRLDAVGRKLAVAARKAHGAFANAPGEVYGDKYRGGSLQSNASASEENRIHQKRADALAHFFDYKPTPGADPAKAERALDKAYRAACDTDAERRKLCAAARRAWTAYRDAEVAFYVEVHGKDAAPDVRATLAEAYRAELEDVVRP
jgi:uncharacterized protein YecT (DUF1311 family)